MTIDENNKPNLTALSWIAYAMAVGTAVIFLYSITATPNCSQFLGTVGVGLLVSGASSMAGGLLGFLFGIPRALQSGNNSVIQPVNTVTGGGTNDDNSITYRANTNLEEISDWLTKILVGVGLTELNVIPHKLNDLAIFLSPGFGTIPHPEVMAISVVLYFVISGFLFGFLWTRLFLGKALREADIAALGKKIRELETQGAKDAKALTLAQQQLNPSVDSPKILQEELQEAIISASPAAKTTIFSQAWELRSKNWERDKQKMERTIPILKALAKSDILDERHEYHGQLGFALKDKINPDWEEAEKELTKAINIRGDWRKEGWIYYEFNHAVCLIQLERSKITNQIPSPYRKEILDDLSVVVNRDDLISLIEQGDRDAQVIREWAENNEISIRQIRQ